MANFLRVIEVIVGEALFKSTRFYIEFSVEKSEKDDLNTAEIVIFNLKEETRELITKGQTVIINAGYEGDVGAIFIGGVDSVMTEKVETEFITTLTCVDGNVAVNIPVNKTYAEGSTSTQIINDLISLSGLEANIIRLGEEVVYSNGKTAYGNLIDELKKVVNDTGSKFYIKDNIINITLEQDGLVIAHVISSETGLLGTPTRKEVGDEDDKVVLYDVNSLLNHNLDVDSIVQVDSLSLVGDYRVVRVRHTGGLEDDFTSELEIIVSTA